MAIQTVIAEHNHGMLTLFKVGNGRMAIYTVIAEQSWHTEFII